MDLNFLLNPVSKRPVNTKNTLKIHIPAPIVTSGEYAVRCDVCLKSFSKRCSLLRHVRNVHGNLAPCEFCKRGLKIESRPYAYKSHLLRCGAFLKAYDGLSDKEKYERAEYFSEKLKQRPMKTLDTVVQQENSPIEDVKMTFPLPMYYTK